VRILKGIRTSRWKYLFSPSDFKEELYDLRRDPGETVNRVESEPGEAKKLRESLSQWLAQETEETSFPSLSPEQIRILKSLGYLQ